MAEQSREPRMSYQEVELLQATVTRTPGTETDSVEIEMTSRAFGKLRFERPSLLYGDVHGGGDARGGEGSSQPRASGTGSSPGSPGLNERLEGSLQICGDLVLDDGVNPPITFTDLYVRDDGIEVVREVDDEDGDTIVKLTLVDVRYFWARRGELWGTSNVLRTDGTFDPATPVHDVRVVLGLILAQLPGRPGLRRLPDGLEKIKPPNLVWRGFSPKEELDRLLKTYGLTFSLGIDSGAIFTDENEPLPEDVRTGAVRMISGQRLPQGAWKRLRRRAFRHRPQAVRIVGRPVVRHVTLDLEPVGFARDPVTGKVDEKKVLPLAEAAAAYNFTVDELAEWVLLSEKDKGAALIARGFGAIRTPSLPPALGGIARQADPEPDPSEAIAEIDRWAFRLFRVPERQAAFLPMQGDPFVIEVEAETFDEVREFESGADVMAEARLRGRLREVRDLARPDLSAPGGGRRDFRGRITLAALAQLSEHRTIVRFVNRPLRPVGPGQIDQDRGLVRFADPVGHLRGTSLFTDAAGNALGSASIPRIAPPGTIPGLERPGQLVREQGQLVARPRVRVTFAYEDSAAAREALLALRAAEQLRDALDRGVPVPENEALPPAERGRSETRYHYTYLAARTAEGALKHVNPGLIDPPNAELLFPLVIPDEGFRMHVTPDGVSNKPELDARAAEIAGKILLGPEEVPGEEGIAFGFFAIEPSSVISRVRWEAAAGVTRTEWSIQNVTATKARLAAGAIRDVVARRIGQGGGS